MNIVQGNEILVHALDRRELDDLEQGDMGERVAKLEPSMFEGVPSDIAEHEKEAK